jgi:hypothetical protein
MSSRVTSHFVPIITVAAGHDRRLCRRAEIDRVSFLFHEITKSPGSRSTELPTALQTPVALYLPSPTRALRLPFSEMPFLKIPRLGLETTPPKFQSSRVPIAPPRHLFPPFAFHRHYQHQNKSF